MRLLQTLIEEEWPDRAIIFANTKHRCEEIWGHLAADGHRVGLLTGDVAQKKRLRILDEFTRGDLDILVATDVAARGLHIPAVTHVFNYDLPDDQKITFTVLVEQVAQAQAVTLLAWRVKSMH